MKTVRLYLILSITLFSVLQIAAQEMIDKRNVDVRMKNLTFYVNKNEKGLIYNSVKRLFADINFNRLNKSKLINTENYSVNIFLMNEIKKLIKDSQIHLTNAYLVVSNKYILKFIVYENIADKSPKLKAIITLIAENVRGKVKFSSPIKYRSKSWKNKQIGNINYFYKNSFNAKLAKKFNRKNSEIAKKLGVSIKKLTFYKCSNYEEVQRLLGIDFDAKSVGIVQSSEAFENTIITGVNSEDFSHDVFHMYIKTKFPDDKDRNFIAEEGYANSIANAYYAKNNGEIISRRELVFYLKEYVEKNLNADLLELFQKNPRVYFQLSNQVSKEVFNQLSVKSTISSLICDEVEKTKGFEGLIRLLRSGKGENAFFKSVDNLIGINKTNFNRRVKKIILNFN